MANTTTLSASISVVDVAAPTTPVSQTSLSDQQTALAEYDSLAVVVPSGTVIGAPVTVSLAAFKPKTVYISASHPFQMKIGAGADVHKIRSIAAYTFSASEPAQILLATGTGVTVDLTVKIALGSAHP
jgi:hypothetical protein